jgi:hypothetical protein
MMLMEGEKSQANTFRIQPLDFEMSDQRPGERIISESGDNPPPHFLTVSN